MEEARATLGRLDQAFLFLVVILTSLLAIVLAYFMWIGDPQKDIFLMSKLLASLVLPLAFSLIVWYWQTITLNREQRMRLRLVAWSSSFVVFMHYVIVLSIILLLRIIATSSQIATIVLLVIILGFGWFPYRQILTRYRAVTLGLHFWERSDFFIWIPFFAGIFVAAVLALIPLLVL